MDIDKLKNYSYEELKAGFDKLISELQKLLNLKDKHKEETGENTDIYDTEINNLTKDLTAIRGEAINRGLTLTALTDLYNN